MATECASCPLRSKPLFTKMSDEEVQQTQRFKAGELQVDPGTQLLMEGSNTPQLYTALRGMGLRYKVLPDGRRQVINLIYPGDFIGLQAGLMGEMKHSVEATTHMTLCVFDRAEFWNFFKNNPARAYDITWLAATEEHFLGEALTTVGQRDAMGSVCWALLRVAQRGEALGMLNNGVMPFPFRQQDLADALGLSLVHTNKTLARMREKQLAVWSDGTLHLHNREEMARIAQIELGDAVMRPLV